MIQELIKSSKKGVFALFSGQAIKIAVQIINLVVLARLLSPEDYGLTAVAIAIVGLGEIIRDFGLSTASIQADTLSQAEKSNLFWLNTAIGLLLTCLVFIVSPFIAGFYNEPRLDIIIKSMSVIFFFNGITTQFRAGLSRDLRFKAISFSEVFASVLSTSIAIYAAYLGYGFWAIVIQQISLNLLLLLVYINFYRWIPSLPDFNVSVIKFINYGKNLMGSQIVGQLSRSFDTFVIGYQFGPELLGLYNRAQQIVFFGLLQINAPATSLALPVLSKLKNDDTEYYRFLNFGQSVLLHIVCFAFSLLAINADLVIRLVLGVKWITVVPLVQILCLGAIFQAASYCFYWVFLSKDHTKVQLQVSLFTKPISMVLIAIGAIWNIYTVAIAIVIGLLFTLIYIVFTLNRFNVNALDLLSRSLTICCSYIFMAVISLITPIYFKNIFSDSILENILFIFLIIFFTIFLKSFRDSAFSLLRLFKFKII